MHSAFASYAGKSCPAKGRTQITQEPAVHPGDPHIHLLSHTMTSLQIAGPDRCRESVFRVIGHSNGFLFGIKRRDVAHGPKDFFLHAPRRFWKSSIDGWLHVKAVVAVVAKFWHSSSGYDRRSLVLRQPVIGEHLVSMLLRNYRTQVSVFVVRP